MSVICMFCKLIILWLYDSLGITYIRNFIECAIIWYICWNTNLGNTWKLKERMYVTEILLDRKIFQSERIYVELMCSHVTYSIRFCSLLQSLSVHTDIIYFVLSAGTTTSMLVCWIFDIGKFQEVLGPLWLIFSSIFNQPYVVAYLSLLIMSSPVKCQA